MPADTLVVVHQITNSAGGPVFLWLAAGIVLAGGLLSIGIKDGLQAFAIERLKLEK